MNSEVTYVFCKKGLNGKLTKPLKESGCIDIIESSDGRERHFLFEKDKYIIYNPLTGLVTLSRNLGKEVITEFKQRYGLKLR